MAVIQISKIQHRRGLASDLPNALSEGEFGFATDTGEVFIGAPNTDLVATRTGFPYQNIKVLTEFDVQRSVTGDVYYHGPLKSQVIPEPPSTPTFDLTMSDVLNKICRVPLFLLSQATYGFYDLSFSFYDPTSSSLAPVGQPLAMTSIQVIGAKTSDLDTIQIGAAPNTVTATQTLVGMSANIGIGAIAVTPAMLSDVASGSVTHTISTITISVTCEPVGSDYQVYLNIIGFVTGTSPNTGLMLHYSGREWLAVQQTA